MRSSLMMSLLRVLTPEEINELTTTSDSHNRVSLTQLMYHKMGVATQQEIESSSLAKILPFTYKEAPVPLEQPAALEPEVQTEPPLVEVKSEPLSKLAPPLAPTVQGEALVAEGRLATSVFILHEKRKIEASVQKLRSQELHASYKKNAALDIEQHKEARNDLRRSSLTGVLVDKKQA